MSDSGTELERQAPREDLTPLGAAVNVVYYNLYYRPSGVAPPYEAIRLRDAIAEVLIGAVRVYSFDKARTEAQPLGAERRLGARFHAATYELRYDDGRPPVQRLAVRLSELRALLSDPYRFKRSVDEVLAGNVS